MNKIRVGVVFGGRSAEHEVSLQSAKNIIAALDPEKYDVVALGIDKEGKWYSAAAANFLLNENNPKLIKLNQTTFKEIAVVPGQDSRQLISLSPDNQVKPIDVAFPIVHGTYGEDGTLQGLLKLLDVPFVGAGVLGSAVGMDKDVMKRLLKGADIPVAKWLCFDTTSVIDTKRVLEHLGLPVFVKPANAGSSVGVSKAKTEAALKEAIKVAFLYDSKILIEESVNGEEVECAVLGNEHPEASLPGKVVPTHEFYSYEAKYIDPNGATFEIPAKLEAAIIKNIQDLSIKTFKALCLEGLSRVDMFLMKNGELRVNEVNTLPGFTPISMYPKLWEVSGVPYSVLIDRLIQLAIERHNREKALKTSFSVSE